MRYEILKGAGVSSVLLCILWITDGLGKRIGYMVSQIVVGAISSKLLREIVRKCQLCELLLLS